MDMTPIHKTFEIEVLEVRKDGGRIAINTASLDRDKDRVMPGGGDVANYLRNPIVQWGHNYRDPWATVGKSNTLEMNPDQIIADFTLRPAANDQDPQNIVRLLWDGGWVRTASIGFIPKQGKPNAEGGTDYTLWELLEWSIVPIPSNQDALRLAVKGFGGFEDAGARDVFAEAIVRVITNDALPTEEKMQQLATLKSWRAQLATSGGNVSAKQHNKEPGDDGDPGRAWMRRLTIDTGRGRQVCFALFTKNTVDVPEDATLLEWDFYLGECNEIPHPESGKTVTFKTAIFVPPIAIKDWQSGYSDSIYSRTQRDCPDADVLGESKYWEVIEWSDVIDSLPLEKSWNLPANLKGFQIDTLTQRGIDTANSLARHVSKRGRVLSAKNESTLKEAQADAQSAADKVGSVLKLLDEQPEDTQTNEGKTNESDESSPEESERHLAETLVTYFDNLKGVLTNGRWNQESF